MNNSLKYKLTFAALLTCLGCSDSGATATTTPCSGNIPCIQSTLACIDPTTAVCDKYLAAAGSYGYCVFRQKVSASCVCVESTVQHCPLAAGGAGGAPMGIQDCTVTGGSATTWGGCHS